MYTVETLLVSQIIANDGCSRISIVKRDHGAETLWAACVPNVELNLRTVCQGHSLLKICATDGHIVTIREYVLAVPLSYTWLSDATIAQENYLGLHYLAGWLCWYGIRVLHPVQPLALLHLQSLIGLLLFGGAATTGATPSTSLVLGFHYFRIIKLIMRFRLIVLYSLLD